MKLTSVKVSCLIMTLALTLVFTSCKKNQKQIQQDTSPVTFFVGLGNGQKYNELLVQAIKDELGIEVKMIHQAAIDTTQATRLQIKNNDFPADIISCASAVPAQLAAGSCMDLMSCTHLTDYFTYQKVSEYTNDDGTIYMLPFTTRLIGVSYNKNLMEENGWSVPQNYEDMLKLKKACDEKGILFAVSANAATGHGFNYLFHLMGSQWINTLEGTSWFTDFINGKADVAPFKKEAVYFDKWVQNGFFGTIHGQDWESQKEYCSKRALFFFDLTNSVSTYEGEMVDQNGNPTGVMLNDEYAYMPWLSEDGTNNCFATYDSLFLGINKKLGQPDQKEKFQKVVKILEFMTTDKAADIFKTIAPDGYVATKSFKIDETRRYYKYKDSIEKGFLMPWYYSFFDFDTIVNTGGQINTYLRGQGSSFDEFMNTLQTNQTAYLNNAIKPLTTFEQDFTREQTAKLNAMGAIISLQNEFDARSISETVSVSLIAYVKNLEDYQINTNVGALSHHAYKGEFQQIDLEAIISQKARSVVGIKMSGVLLKKIAEQGVSDKTSVYPYVLAAKEDIKDDLEYVVAVPLESLNQNYIEEFTQSGAIIASDGKNVSAQIKPGMHQILESKTLVSVNDLIW